MFNLKFNLIFAPTFSNVRVNRDVIYLMAETRLGPPDPRNQEVPHGDSSNVFAPSHSDAIGESGGSIPATNDNSDKQNVQGWYVIRGVFGKAKALHSILQAENKLSFYPLRYVIKDRTRKLVPAIPNLCFVRGTLEEVYSIIDAPLEERNGLSHYLTPYIDPATNKIMRVPDGDMERFISAFTIIGEQAVWLDPCTLDLKKGDRVRVLDGPFKGVEGYIKRIYGQQRVIVALKNFAAIATAYVPTPLVARL